MGHLVKSSTWVIPHEVADANGGSLANPIGQVGSGPFNVYIRPRQHHDLYKNHDYFLEDVRYPGNKLPYVDKVTFTIIPDLSTRNAALRTGQIDRLGSIPVSELSALKGTIVSNNKELLYREILSESSNQIVWRSDLEPFGNNLKFRQALSMAIDRQAIIDKLFDGHAAYSACRVPVFYPEFIPLDLYPAEIQELYQYNPEKARQYQSDAGFVAGYTLEVICPTTDTDGQNILQMVAADWKTNLNVTLNIKDLYPTSCPHINTYLLFMGITVFPDHHTRRMGSHSSTSRTCSGYITTATTKIHIQQAV